MPHTTAQIAQRVAGELLGAADLPLTGVNALEQAKEGELTFIRDAAQAPRWAQSKASAALIGPQVDLSPGSGRALIRVSDADLALANILELFAPPIPQPDVGVHPSAVVDPSAQLGDDVAIGPCTVIGRRSIIGAGVKIHANVTISDDVRIGDHCTLWPGVVIRERCELGAGCIVHANAAIGADGFGYRPAPSGLGLVKIPQVGAVRIGSQVEIGAGVCIDRGKFAATIIGDGCKIDNLVQIAHNCVLGRCVVIAGCSGLAGSVQVGDGAVIGGNVSIRDQVVIGPGATIAGSASVMNDVPAGETWAGYPAKPAKIAMQEYAAIRKLPELIRQARKLAP